LARSAFKIYHGDTEDTEKDEFFAAHRLRALRVSVVKAAPELAEA